MTSVTITTSSDVFTFSVAEIKDIVEEIVAQPDTIPMPGSAPADTIIIDLGGATKKITISGTIYNDGTDHLNVGTAVTIISQKQWLEGLVDGAQSLVTFTSNYASKTSDGGSTPGSWPSTTVVISRLSFTENEGKPNEIDFRMTLDVGTG